jgi:hypothetical protein
MRGFDHHARKCDILRAKPRCGACWTPVQQDNPSLTSMPHFWLIMRRIRLIFRALRSRIRNQIRNRVHDNDDVGKARCAVCFLRSAGESIPRLNVRFSFFVWL